MDKNIYKFTNERNKEKIYSKFKVDLFKFYFFLFFLYISKEQENNEFQQFYSYIELSVKGRGNINLYYYEIIICY